MIGNISKVRGKLGATGPQGPEGPQGKEGSKGEKGDTPVIAFRLDENTGDLYYSSDGIYLDKEYVNSNDLVTKEELEKLGFLKEDVANKVDIIDMGGGNINDIQYPSVKAVYDFGSGVALNAADVVKQEIIDYQITPLSNRVKNVEEQVQEKASQSDLEAFATDLSKGKADKTTVEGLQTEVLNLNNRTARLIKKLTVAEDVNSITISTDEEGNPFSLNDFEIRFCGKHSTTMWISVGKGEKYFSVASVANNNGLPCFNQVADYFVQNVVANYIYTGSNYCGTKHQQEIGALGVDGKYAAGNGRIEPFNTTPVSPNVSTIKLQAISGGVINAGTIIEVWGY